MTIKKSFNYIINKHQSKILLSLFTVLAIVSIVFISLVSLVSIQNNPVKNSFASAVYQCAMGETLSGTNCLSTAISSPIYTEACESGYAPMDFVCVTFTQKVCTDYPEAIVDPVDTTLCKIGNINNVLLSEVTDNDGRQCKGTGYNFKRYNVSFPLNSTLGPIVCSSAFSATFGKANFRFIPKTITNIKNLVTTQTGTSTPTCAVGYTLIVNQCSISAKITGCSSGEYLAQNTQSCQTCSSGSTCTNFISQSICPNGGTLTNNLCIAANQISVTNYTDGCTSSYTRYDQTCAIEEIRTHDKGCSYFYASDNINTTAVLDLSTPVTALNRCSTGGRTDFANNSIVKISDLQCDGPGTAWYSYNVAYDPLVCGNTYDVNNKAAFRWSEKTFTKIVGLQKIGALSSVCPSSWTLVANTNTCSQLSVVQTLNVTNNGGGGLIIITNQSSSSSSISTFSSITKATCTNLQPNQYLENGECKNCPSGTIVTSSNPNSIKDCITVATVDKPTIRSGGDGRDQNLAIAIVCSFIMIAYIMTQKYQHKFISKWFKVK